MLLDALLEKRLVVVSGKGGVGKSLVSAALAVAAQARGKRVLLVDVDAPQAAARYVGAPVRAQPTEIAEGLSSVSLSPQAVMDEYVRHVVKLDLLVRRILKSPVYQRFFAAAPGLKELMLLGKIMVLAEEREGLRRRRRFDLIVLDAPATGHGLSLLKVPLAAAKAVPVGPIGSNARRVLELLRDGSRTALVVVAIPEEMAVVEAIQLHESATREVGLVAAAVVLNGFHERRFSHEQEAEVLRLSAAGATGRLSRGLALERALFAARRQLRRHRLSRFYERRLRRALPLPLVKLPYLFRDSLGPLEVSLLADRLAAP